LILGGTIIKQRKLIIVKLHNIY